MRRFAFTSLLLFGVIGAVSAQEVSKFSFAVGGGFTQPVGNTSRHLDEGWNVQGGVGFNFNQYVGAMVQVDYNRFGINGATLNNVGFPGGDVNVFSATLSLRCLSDRWRRILPPHSGIYRADPGSFHGV